MAGRFASARQRRRRIYDIIDEAFVLAADFHAEDGEHRLFLLVAFDHVDECFAAEQAIAAGLKRPHGAFRARTSACRRRSSQREGSRVQPPEKPQSTASESPYVPSDRASNGAEFYGIITA